MPYVGVVYYIWVGIFSLATIAQFWSFANDIYRREAGERLFPFIFLGATLGAPVGAWLAGRLFKAGVSPYRHDARHHRAPARPPRALPRGRPAGVQTPGPGGRRRPALGGGRLQARLREPLPAAARALLIVLLNVVNTTGNYIWDKTLLAAAHAAVAADPSLSQDAFIGSVAAELRTLTFTVLGALLQAFAVSRIVKYLGMTGVILALPLVALGGYGLIAAGRRPRRDPLDQDRRERDRLLGHEHRAAARLAADQPRREVQGQAGGRPHRTGTTRARTDLKAGVPEASSMRRGTRAFASG